MVTGCAAQADSAPRAEHSERGRLVRAESVHTYSPIDVAKELGDTGFDAAAVRYGVETYRLVYDTVDSRGQATTASGLLAVPISGDRDLTGVVFEHGTMFAKADAPSVAEHSGDLAATLAFASAGFAGITPDYLGLGAGPGAHPYLDLPSETTASLDMVRAAGIQAESINRPLRPELEISGFSQGGPAALALARALQNDSVSAFRPAAVAAISGPYAVRAAELPALLDNRINPVSGTLYISYTLVAWNRLHPIYRSPEELFRAPYAAGIESLFDGSHSDVEIAQTLPPLDALLTPKAFDLLRDPSGPFADALRTADASCRDWTPRFPIRLYTASADTDVAQDNSAQCRTDLGRNGVDAPITDLGPLDHPSSGKAGVAVALRWFLESHPAH
ncbi:lipase [Nocardia panacis]|uniref:lipase n=1 Tax=Nocardia panacis TaxID=2340916 RepID=UPI0011C439D4|nr:lipase [Nocardia panacis]